ncbi:hypothetical protein A2U13_08755 [Fusobacterium necrophorum subsp. funduliforme]|uniref:YddF family protein n=1 Tax=Fusobacterium necrophorum TaxID=859 RepID=UPI0007869C07|nr:YddF family protein [Fusobacterium necrophorum]KYM67106.1 hypothetical protein A2U13_08755 [Fusobacterium necrophorum subsp. funduliforme]
MKKIALLNTSICTTTGIYKLTDITLNQAKKIVAENKDNLLSAIGHESTAQIMTELLEIPISVNRIQFAQENNQKAIVFKLNGRAPEGTILSKSEIEAIGYKFQLLERLD